MPISGLEAMGEEIVGPHGEQYLGEQYDGEPPGRLAWLAASGLWLACLRVPASQAGTCI